MDGHEVADFCPGKLHPVGQKVERRAQRAGDRRRFALGRIHAVADDDRVVLADDLTKVAGSRQMVVQAAVGDEEELSVREFTVDDPGDVETGLADEIASEFDDEFRAGKIARGLLREFPEICGDGRQIERLFAGKIGNAEAAAEVQHAQGRGRKGG